MDFVFHRSIKSLAEAGTALLSQLLEEIQLTEIAECKEGRLHHGMYSAGNLFKRKEDLFCEFAALIRAELSVYA